jgi:hypothetical protein
MGAPIIWNGNNAKLLKPNLDFGECLVKTGTFDPANNQAAAADLTGLVFANASTRAARIILSVHIDATADLFALFELDCVQKGAAWELSQSYIGDQTNFNFSITAAGQIQYSSGNETGYSDSVIKWQAVTLDI